ncbi:MAG: BamA/TamA family outer membrane protein [Calditrichia bacterium]
MKYYFGPLILIFIWCFLTINLLPQAAQAFPDSLTAPVQAQAAVKVSRLTSAHLQVTDSAIYGWSGMHPNFIPYRSRRSFGAHLLALPSYAWRAIWYPLGKTVVWMEHSHFHEQAIAFFFNEDFSAGIFPIFNVGGSLGLGAGLMGFHNNLFHKGHQVSFRVLFGSLDDNYSTLEYKMRNFAGIPATLKLSGIFISDSEENFFPTGNNSRESGKSSYDFETGGGGAGLNFNLLPRLKWQLNAGLRHIDISYGEGYSGTFFPDSLPEFGTRKLWQAGSGATLDFRNGWPRTLSGALLQMDYRYTEELSGNRFQFHTLDAEVQIFFSPFFLAKNRRFSLRGWLQKNYTINGKEIPFYELSLLGDADNLRGYPQNRFRAEGALLFNLEYRYPVWDHWDAVIFFDEGQVFNHFSVIKPDRFHWAAGGGLRFMTANGFIMRTEVAASPDHVQFLLEFAPNF